MSLLRAVRGDEVAQKAILKRLVASQRLADGLAGVRVPGFAGSEFEDDGCVFGVCCARVAL